ncbi:outer membrane protein assembly factor BamB family protein [Streptomyces albicerus]|uniref:outer membrane protein assembly factor BamB family protein n=1 Tax=Streptomyces albicerus TaxID=2569859 RepID=UPI001788C42C|nr:PQQ-binding-like beta-propeller repeat protein [Streptomyces albicerus]
MRAAASIAVCSLAACGGGQAPAEGKAPREASSGSTSIAGSGGTRPQGPPQDFEPEAIGSFDWYGGQWPLPPTFGGGAGDFLALGDRLAYTYDTKDVGITAYRLDDGEITWCKKVPDGDSVALAPRLAGTAVIGAFARSTEGRGTSAGHHAITVAAYDAATGKALWTRDVVEGDGTAVPTAHIVGATDRRVLVSAEDGSSALVDVRTGRLVWTDRDFEGVDLEDTVAVGRRDDGVFVGKSTSDGRQLWKRQVVIGEGLTADPGPGLTLAGGIGQEDLLVDPVTGKTSLDMKDGASDCHYDGWTTTVCSGTDGSGSATVTAVDLRSARVLWRLPDEAANRIVPQVTSAWHGLVYAEANGPMTLDARTGKDLRTDISLAPSMVNDRYGLVYDDLDRIIKVYRARHRPA